MYEFHRIRKKARLGCPTRSRVTPSYFSAEWHLVQLSSDDLIGMGAENDEVIATVMDGCCLELSPVLCRC